MFEHKLTQPEDPNSRIYVLLDGSTIVNFLMLCKLYDSVKNSLFRPFYPAVGEFGWPVPDSTRLWFLIDRTSKHHPIK